MESHNFHQQGRYFYMEINPDMGMGELPSIFFRRFKDGMSNLLTFFYFAGNEVEVPIEKGHRTAIIVTGYTNLLTLYGLKEGGWLSICYVGSDKFLNTEVKDHNMCTKEPCFPPVKLTVDIKPTVVVNEVIEISDHTSNGSPHAQQFSHSPLTYSPINMANGCAGLSYAEHSTECYKPDVEATGGILSSVPTMLSGGISSHINEEPISAADQVVSLDHPDLITEVLSICGINSYYGLPVPNADVLLNSFHNETMENSNTTSPNVDTIMAVVNNGNSPPPPHPLRNMPPPQLLHTSQLYTVVRIISNYQASHYSMLLPSAFASQDFPSRLNFVYIRELHKPLVLMTLRWRSPRSSEAFLTRGWRNFSVSHGLKGGSVVHFSIPVYDETVMFFQIIRL